MNEPGKPINTPPADEVVEAAVQRFHEDYNVPIEEARRLCQTVSVCTASDFMTRVKAAIMVPAPENAIPLDNYDFYLRVDMGFEMLNQLGQMAPALNKCHPSLQDDIRGIQAECLASKSKQDGCKEVLAVLRKVMRGVKMPDLRPKA